MDPDLFPISSWTGGLFIGILVGLQVGMWIGRYLSPSLSDLGLTESQRQQLEKTIEKRRVDAVSPVVLVFVFCLSLLVPLGLLVWFSVPSPLIQFGLLLGGFAMYITFAVASVRKQAQVLHAEIENLRRGSI